MYILNLNTREQLDTYNDNFYNKKAMLAIFVIDIT